MLNCFERECRSKKTRFDIITLCTAFILSNAAALNHAQAATETAFDIKHATLEDLMQIDIYSASRRLERAQGIPAAIFVLTNEDIQRARVTNIPDALRLVPGVEVARIDGNKWGVSIRGFIGGFGGTSQARTANKLLVLIDGRSIYDPLFSGVFWETQDVMLADVDRIEVVRGPGGALWGANAVNGVINIITKNARDSQGGLVEVGGGSEERAFGAARYGWQTGDKQYARVYARSLQRDTGFSPSGNPHDQGRMQQTGFRWDADLNARDSFKLSGDVYATEAGQRDNATTTQNVDHQGGNLLARWKRKLSNTENLRAQIYYDRTRYDSLSLDQDRDTYDFEFQHDLIPFSAHQIVWGLSYRHTYDTIGTVMNAIQPEHRTDVTSSGFVQDTIALVPNRWQFTFGTKFEHNDYSKNEWQPNVRLAWTPSEKETWWAAVSRAVRVPSRLEADIVLGSRLGDGVATEQVSAYELGYRRLVTKDFWWDIATFYNQYRNLITIEQGFQFKNKMHGNTQGVGLASRWQIIPSWRVDASYTYLSMNFDVDPSSIAVVQPTTTEKSNPHYQYSLRSALDIAHNWQFDATLRVVDDLPALHVPSYTALDLGLNWLLQPDLQLALVAQNLLDSHHPEQTVVANGSGTEVQRGYYAKLTWRY